MDTILLILILIFSLFSCKKDSDTKKIQEESNKNLTGIFELYPSYKKIYIKFETSPKCILYENDEIKNCFYLYRTNRLSIYMEKDIPEGVFIIENGNDIKFIRGLWKNQVRFLKKIHD